MNEINNDNNDTVVSASLWKFSWSGLTFYVPKYNILVPNP